MGKVVAAITTSVDGYVTGPDDGPELGLGRGGERLHYWVMGGPWTYETEHEPGRNMAPEDRAFFDRMVANLGGALCGRGMFEAAGRWGGTNPWGVPVYVVTHRVADDPPAPDSGFVFVDSFQEALARAREAAGDKDVSISGGADVIRQGLDAGEVDELVISTAPVVLGAGKRLFDGFTKDTELRILEVVQSPFVSHVRYAVEK
jgi:dihydrofolate reductase